MALIDKLYELFSEFVDLQKSIFANSDRKTFEKSFVFYDKLKKLIRMVENDEFNESNKK